VFRGQRVVDPTHLRVPQGQGAFLGVFWFQGCLEGESFQVPFRFLPRDHGTEFGGCHGGLFAGEIHFRQAEAETVIRCNRQRHQDHENNQYRSHRTRIVRRFGPMVRPVRGPISYASCRFVGFFLLDPELNHDSRV